MATLATRIRLTEQRLAKKRKVAPDLTNLLFDGFEDVVRWLDGEKPQPDPHRLDDLVRLPLPILTDASKGVSFAGELYFCVLVCMAKRYTDKTGIPFELDETETDSRRAFIDWILADGISNVLEHNAALLFAHAEAQTGRGFRLRKLEFRGESGNALGLRLVMPVTEECQLSCESLRWEQSAHAQRQATGTPCACFRCARKGQEPSPDSM